MQDSFDIFAQHTSEETDEQPDYVSEATVERIREAFDAAGIIAMQDRQKLIETCVSRPIGSVHELLATDVRSVLSRIKSSTEAKPATEGSAWDNREEDTWIDKL